VERKAEQQIARRELVIPPFPEPAAEDLPTFQFATTMRKNALSGFPRRAYEEAIVRRPFLGRHSLVINDPDAIRHVLVDSHERYGRTPATLRMLRPLLGDGLFISEGRSWRIQRRTVAPAFTPKSVGVLVPHMLSAADEAIQELEAAARRGPIDMLSNLQRLALEIAGRTMFSLQMRASGPKLRDFITRYGRRLGRPYLLDMLMPAAWPTLHDLARSWFRRAWISYIDEIIAERQQNRRADRPPDLLDLLSTERDPETGNGFSPAQLRDQVTTMILAGHETTAVALFWSVYLLALAPDVQECVADEVTRSGNLEAPDVTCLTLTRAVIDEAMRLYPPAFVIVRAAREPDVVAGFRVKPGDIAVIAPFVLHRHRRFWSAPNAFDPDRFMPGASPPPKFAYLPFGVGPRVCVGAHFALTEATLVLARLICHFRIDLTDSIRPVQPVAVVTTQPDHPPLFMLTPR